MSKTVKKLYLAKDLEDLNNKVSTSNKLDPKPMLLMNTANTLFEKARTAEDKDRDEELAYVMYMRYMETVLACLKKAEKLNQRDHFQKLLGKSKITEANSRCEKLSASLKKRYDITNLTEKLDSENKELEKLEAVKFLEEKHNAENKKLQPGMNGVIQKPADISTDTELNDKEGDMQPTQLKNLIEQKSTSMLILDCRPASDFTRAHIKHSDCVSIPCEILHAGLTAHKLSEKLKMECPESYHAWNKRANFDRIIVYDWNSSVEHKVERTSYLIDAMTEWDPYTKYKSKPFILQGGIRNLYYTFPTLINKPLNVNEDEKKDQAAVPTNTFKLEDISYPTDFEDVDNQNVANSTLKTNGHPLPSLTKRNNDVSDRTEVEDVDQQNAANSMLNTNGHSPLLIKHHNEANSSVNVAVSAQNSKKVIVDRSTKPTSNSTTTTKPTSTLTLTTTTPTPTITTTKPTSNLTATKPTSNLTATKPASNLTTAKLKDENLDAPRVLKRSHSNPNLAQISVDDSMENESFSPSFNRSLKPANRSITGENHLVRRRDFQAVRSTEKTKNTGLKNLGNTCYMNSIMQCINHTTELVNYFRSQEYRHHLNQRGTTKGDFTEEVAAAIKEMNMGHRSIALHELKSVLSRCYKPFRNYDQQDSHEFLTYLLDWMHEDLNKALKQPLKEQKNDDMKDKEAADTAWRDYTTSNNSKIVELFCGQQKSSVRCVNCGKASTTFDTFFILSIPIPVSPNGKKYTIQQCIDLYTSEEEISDWSCSNCKIKCRAKKKIDLWRLPPYLIIHFQRFYLENWWRKRLTDIEFPIESLDLNRKAMEKLYNVDKDYTYQLYGVSNHYGTIEGGHYTAYCRKDKSWAKFDDSEVLSMQPNNVSTSAGYILFYSRKDIDKFF